MNKSSLPSRPPPPLATSASVDSLELIGDTQPLVAGAKPELIAAMGTSGNAPPPVPMRAKDYCGLILDNSAPTPHNPPDTSQSVVSRNHNSFELENNSMITSDNSSTGHTSSHRSVVSKPVRTPPPIPTRKHELETLPIDGISDTDAEHGIRDTDAAAHGTIDAGAVHGTDNSTEFRPSQPTLVCSDGAIQDQPACPAVPSRSKDTANDSSMKPTAPPIPQRRLL